MPKTDNPPQSYRVIPRCVAARLSLQDIWLYVVLCFKSDFRTGRSVVLQETLSETSGIPSRTLHDALQRIERAGLIEIEYTTTPDGKRKTNYLVAIPPQDFIMVERSLMEMPMEGLEVKEAVKLRGFLVMAKCLCLNNTAECHWSQREMEQHTKASRRTFARFFEMAVTRHYMKPLPGVGNGYRILLPFLNRDVVQPCIVPAGEPELLAAHYRSIHRFCREKRVFCPPYLRTPMSWLAARFAATDEELMSDYRNGRLSRKELQRLCLGVQLRTLGIHDGQDIYSLNYFVDRLRHDHPELAEQSEVTEPFTL
jgi:hypothetical protein